MGLNCSCHCKGENNLNEARNFYELAESMEEENQFLMREALSKPKDKEYKQFIKDFISLSNVYIKKFKSIPDGCSLEEFVYLREVIAKCYVNLTCEEDYFYFRKEMKYLVDIKMAHSLGLAI